MCEYLSWRACSGEAKFKLHFMSGGAIDFGQVIMNITITYQIPRTVLVFLVPKQDKVPTTDSWTQSSCRLLSAWIKLSVPFINYFLWIVCDFLFFFKPLRFHCIGGSLGSNPGLQRLWHRQPSALTTRLDLMFRIRMRNFVTFFANFLVLKNLASNFENLY